MNPTNQPVQAMISDERIAEIYSFAVEQNWPETKAVIDRLRAAEAELERANNEFGSQTAHWPGLQERIAEGKEYAKAQWRRAESAEAKGEALKSGSLMKCGHHKWHMLTSAETGLSLYCAVCDEIGAKRDRITDLEAKVEAKDKLLAQQNIALSTADRELGLRGYDSDGMIRSSIIEAIAAYESQK